MSYFGRRIAAVIFARTASSRIEKKMAYPLSRGCVLDYVIERVKIIPHIDVVILATTEGQEDDWIEQNSKKHDISCFRGSVNDVVGRLHEAVVRYADDCSVILRVCADNPFLGYETIGKNLRSFINNKVDLYTPFEMNSLPFGMSAVMMTRPLLKLIDNEAIELSHREHVENFILERRSSVNWKVTYSEIDNTFFPWLSLTFDTRNDLPILRKVDKLIELELISHSLEDLVDYIKRDRYILIAPEESLFFSFIETEWASFKNFEIIVYKNTRDFHEITKDYRLDIGNYGDICFFNNSGESPKVYSNFGPLVYYLRTDTKSHEIVLTVTQCDNQILQKRYKNIYDVGEKIFVTTVLQACLGFFFCDNLKGLEAGGVWIRQESKFNESMEFRGFRDSPLSTRVKSYDVGMKHPGGQFDSVVIDASDNVYYSPSSGSEAKLLGSLCELPLPLIWLSVKTLRILATAES